MVSGVRTPAASGSFYPDDKNELASQLRDFFAKTKPFLSNKKLKALLVPHAGYMYSGQTAAWGYKQLENISKNPHFVLIGPSHFYPSRGIVSSSSSFWQTPLGNVEHIPAQDEKFSVFLDETPHHQEHSLEVQIPFLQYLFKDCSITCFLTGQSLNFGKAADYLLNTFDKSIFVFSSDLSHYLSEAQAKKKDKKTVEAILNLDENYFLAEENTACGMNGVLILIAMAKKAKWKGELLYHNTSATASGDHSQVVGYGAIGFW